MKRAAPTASVAAAFAVAVVTAAATPEPAVRNRWHFAFAESPAFRVSVHFRRDGSGDETRLLVAGAGVRLVLVSRQTPSRGESLERVDDPASGAYLERRLFLSGWESVPACRSVERPDACLVFRSGSGDATAAISALSGKDAATVRERLRRLAGPELEKRVLALAPLVPRFADFRFYRDDFLGLVWPEAFAEAGRIETGRPAAGCEFDATFGFPCDARERKVEARRLRPK